MEWVGWLALGLKVVAAGFLLYIADRDRRTGKIRRWHALAFVILSFLSVAIRGLDFALYLFLVSGAVAAISWRLGVLARIDVLLIPGSALLLENIWFPFLVAMALAIVAAVSMAWKKRPFRMPYGYVLAGTAFAFIIARVVGLGG